MQTLAILTTFIVAPLFIMYRINKGQGWISSILLSIPLFFTTVMIAVNNFTASLIVNTITIAFFLYKMSNKSEIYIQESSEQKISTPVQHSNIEKDPSDNQGTIFINYTNYEGTTTEREIQVTNTSKDYIKGYCLLQHDIRTFRRDRINGYITDVKTGKSIHPNDYHFYRW